MNNISNESNNEFNTNCVALTIRRDYRSTIISNVIDKSIILCFKVLVIIGLLNFFSTFFLKHLKYL